MGFQNREYYRESNPSTWSLENAPVVKWIIISTVIVFLLQIFIVKDVNIDDFDPNWPGFKDEQANDRISPKQRAIQKEQEDKAKEELKRFMKELGNHAPRISVITEWLQLDPLTTLKKGQIWRLITIVLVHDRGSLFHIAFNMICLFMFGREMERIYGSREFLMIYLMAAVVSSLAYLALDAWLGVQIPAVGASGAIMAVMMLFTLHYPRHTILLFWVIPVEMRYAMAIYVIVDLYPVLLSLSGDRLMSNIGHSAHLGGALFGFLYYRFNWQLSGLFDRVPRQWPTRIRPSVSTRPNAEQLIYKFPQRTRLTEEETEQVDRILAKISIVGKDGLTDEERETLNRASNTLKWKKEYLD